MLTLALGSIPLLVFESFIPTTAALLNWAISGLFAVELGVRLILHGPGRLGYAARKWYDFAIVLLTLIPIFMPLRALRSVRVLKLLRLLVFAERGIRAGRRIWANTSGRYVMVVACALVASSCAGVWFFENGRASGIDTPGETAWWAIVTMTTVGYGDISPETSGGKTAAAVLMLAGITLFSMLTANLAAFFSTGKQETEREELAEQVKDLAAAVERLSAQIESGSNLRISDEP